MEDLFDKLRPEIEEVSYGVFLLANFVDTRALLKEIQQITSVSPFRHMETPGGHTMSIAMTNCGDLGWVTSRSGYRYDGIDPVSGEPWPQMPIKFRDLASEATKVTGFGDFYPDACLINRYDTGARLTPHQDKNEKDFAWPIVSVSIGVPAVFQLYGRSRSGSPKLIKLRDGDVMVWGGQARLHYHGVKPIKNAQHPYTGHYRYNLTFRRAG